MGDMRKNSRWDGRVALVGVSEGAVLAGLTAAPIPETLAVVLISGGGGDTFAEEISQMMQTGVIRLDLEADGKVQAGVSCVGVDESNAVAVPTVTDGGVKVDAVKRHDRAPVVIELEAGAARDEHAVFKLAVGSAHIEADAFGHRLADGEVIGLAAGSADAVRTGAHHDGRHSLGFADDPPVEERSQVGGG